MTPLMKVCTYILHKMRRIHSSFIKEILLFRIYYKTYIDLYNIIRERERG